MVPRSARNGNTVLAVGAIVLRFASDVVRSPRCKNRHVEHTPQFLHEASIGSPYYEKSFEEWRRNGMRNGGGETKTITQKDARDFEPNEFHSPAPAARPDIQFQEITRLYPKSFYYVVRLDILTYCV